MEVDELRREARAWLAANAHQAPPDYGAICPPELIDAARVWQRRLADAGWAGLHWPAEDGGRGLTVEHTAAWIEECATAGVPAVLNMVGLVLAAGSILHFGTPEQRHRHLGPTLAGEQVWCQLFSEPGAGSDLASLSTRAERDGERFIVNGQKVWCSGGRVSDWGILMARTDPAAPRHRGISFFLLDMRTPGIEVRPLRQMTGDAEFDEVFLTDVAVPATDLVGPLNGGWGVGMAVLTNERGHIGASVISLERRLAGMAGELAAIDGHAGSVERDRMAALLVRGRAAVALGHRQGPEASVAGSLMKLAMTDLFYDVAMGRADLAGARSLLDGPEADGVLAAPAGRIAGGTSQIQRSIIGERLLGLPPRAFRNPLTAVGTIPRVADDDYRDPDVDRLGQPPRRRFPTRIVAVIVITLVCGAFISQNRERVNVDFLVFDRDARTWVVIILSMALGALLAEFVRLALKRRRQASE